MKFYETSNKDYELILVASYYNKEETARLLNSRYDNNVGSLKDSTRTLKEFELYTNCDQLSVGALGIFDQHVDQETGNIVTSTWQLVP